MDWRNSNDDLTRQSDARRERENQPFENGIRDRDLGGFGGMRQGPGGDPLARMRGAQPDPFANRVGGGLPPRQPFGQPQGLPQQNQPPQHLSQHEDWMDKTFKAVTGLWKHLTSYVWPVLSESDDMFRSDYKLRKGLTAALLYYGAVGGFSFLFGLFTRFATAPGIFISLVGGGVSGGIFLYKNSQNKEWGLVDDSPKEDSFSQPPQPSEFGAPRDFMSDGFGSPNMTPSSDLMGEFGQHPRREVPNEFRNFGSSGGWDDGEGELPFPKRQGFEPMTRPKPTSFEELEGEDGLETPSKGIPSVGASAKDIWGSIDEESEDLEDDSEETEDNSSSSREELEHPKVEEVSESAFSADLAGGIVEPELVSRRLLVDKYLSILDGSSLKPDWSREVPKDSVEFKELETFLRDAQTGGVKGLSEMDWVNVQLRLLQIDQRS